MKTLFTVFVMSLALPLSLLAGETKMAFDASSSDVEAMLSENTYGEGGLRQGMFFSDLRDSLPGLKYRFIDHPMESVWPYQIPDYDMIEAVDAAKEAGNLEMVAKLEALNNAYKNSRLNNGPTLSGAEFKKQFIVLLHEQFDTKVEIMENDLKERLRKHNYNYNSMLNEYKVVLIERERQRTILLMKKAGAYALITAIFFSGVIFGF